MVCGVPSSPIMSRLDQRTSLSVKFWPPSHARRAPSSAGTSVPPPHCPTSSEVMGRVRLQSYSRRGARSRMGVSGPPPFPPEADDPPAPEAPPLVPPVPPLGAVPPLAVEPPLPPLGELPPLPLVPPLPPFGALDVPPFPLEPPLGELPPLPLEVPPLPSSAEPSPPHAGAPSSARGSIVMER